MAKKPLRRVLEVETGMVHYAGVGCGDNVTLCGHTGFGGGEFPETGDPVTCWTCTSIVAAIHAHAKPQAGDHAIS